MAEESAKLRIPYLAAAQAQKHVTHNEAMTLLDTLVQLSVLDKDLTAPPGAPDEGDCYIVAGGGGTATDAWVGWETRIARYIDGEWRSYLPGEGGGAGWLAWVQDEDAMYRFDGADWTLAGIEGPQGPQGPAYQPDAAVDAIAGRAAYDGEDAAFSVLVVSDAGNSGQPTLYFKLSSTSADWSAGITWLPETSGPAFTVRAATTAAITIAADLNSGDTIDGVTLVAGELVLVKDQAAPEENGVYVAGASPSRAAVLSTYDQHAGALVTVQEGAVNADTQWQCVSDKGGTLETTAIDFLDLFTALTPPGEITENYDTAARAGWIGLDGATIVDGALDNPKCAARYPWMVSGDDLILPDRRGMFDRIWDNGAGADPDAGSRTARAGDGQTGDYPGTEQPDGIKAHTHSQNIFQRTLYQYDVGGINGLTTVVTGGELVGDSAGGAETRPINHSVCKQMRLG